MLLLIMTLNLAVNQAKATYGPVGATSARERPAGARSPLGSRSIVRGHVRAAPAGQQNREKEGMIFFNSFLVRLSQSLSSHGGFAGGSERERVPEGTVC